MNGTRNLTLRDIEKTPFPPVDNKNLSIFLQNEISTLLRESGRNIFLYLQFVMSDLTLLLVIVNYGINFWLDPKNEDLFNDILMSYFNGINSE